MHTNAGWENKTKNKAICRWFVAWSEIQNHEYAGAVAGYGGGGAFIVERFYAKTNANGKFTALWMVIPPEISGVQK